MKFAVFWRVCAFFVSNCYSSACKIWHISDVKLIAYCSNGNRLQGYNGIYNTITHYRIFIASITKLVCPAVHRASAAKSVPPQRRNLLRSPGWGTGGGDQTPRRAQKKTPRAVTRGAYENACAIPCTSIIAQADYRRQDFFVTHLRN